MGSFQFYQIWNLMVDAKLVNKGNHSLFICGNNQDAKNKLMQFLEENFNWDAGSFLDLGRIEQSRVVEAYVPLWVSIMQAVGTPVFNLKIVR